MNEVDWNNLCEYYAASDYYFDEIECSQITGFILCYPNLAEAEHFENEMYSRAWGRGVCSLIDGTIRNSSFHKRNELLIRMGELPDMNPPKYVVIFKDAKKYDLFNIIKCVTADYDAKFSENELQMISDLFKNLDWFSPRYIGSKVLRLGVDYKALVKRDLNDLISGYQTVMRKLYPNNRPLATKQVRSFLESNGCLYFLDFGM